MHVRLLKLDQLFPPLYCSFSQDPYESVTRWWMHQDSHEDTMKPLFLEGVTISKGKQRRQRFVQNKYIHNHKPKPFGQALILLKRLGNHRLEMLFKRQFWDVLREVGWSHHPTLLSSPLNSSEVLERPQADYSAQFQTPYWKRCKQTGIQRKSSPSTGTEGEEWERTFPQGKRS